MANKHYSRNVLSITTELEYKIHSTTEVLNFVNTMPMAKNDTGRRGVQQSIYFAHMKFCKILPYRFLAGAFFPPKEKFCCL